MRSALLIAALLLAACADDADRGADAAADTIATGDTGAAAGTGALAANPVLAAWLARIDPSVLTRWGACPFECCVYREWVAEGPVVVRAEPTTDAAVVVTLPPGTRFDADTGFVRITGAQLVVATRPVEAWRHEVGRRDGGRPDTIPAGDTLLVLEHLGEGHVMLTHGDDLVSAEQFWPSPDGWTPYDGGRGQVVAGQHDAEWWARVRTADGTTGWIDAYRSELGNVDACGVPG